MIETIAAATIGGMLIGQISVGVPLGLRLNRRERPQPASRVEPAGPPRMDFHPSALFAGWPHDKAADMLATWRDNEMPVL